MRFTPMQLLEHPELLEEYERELAAHPHPPLPLDRRACPVDPDDGDLAGLTPTNPAE